VTCTMESLAICGVQLLFAAVACAEDTISKSN
jgi:hypothetical protein